ncbi:hypothetical protein [Actinomadura sp. 3N508]|uniref:hypothetical protein n=1 Tax=Actinomadura sp. 3N508 TaxID=3375153 RepID=UPI0037AA0177
MDAYEGPACLEWWANPLTCLYSIDVRVSVVNDDSGWHTSAEFDPPLTGDHRETWNFFMDAAPYFTLRFKDDETATIDVHVNKQSENGLTLTATD